MESVALTRVAAFSPFVGFLEEGGSDVGRHLASIGIPSDCLRAEESLIPLCHAGKFVAAVSRREGIAGLGLEVGSRTSMASLGIAGAMLGQSLSMLDLIRKLLRLVPAIDSGAHVWVEPAGTAGLLSLCIRHHIDVGRSIANDYGMLLLISAVRMAAGESWRPERAWLDAGGKRDLSRCEMLSEAAVEQTRDHAGFAIPSALLASAVSPPTAVRGTAPVNEETIHATSPPADLVGSVSAAVEAAFGARIPTLPEAAELAGTSGRSLQRRLRDAGLGYGELVDRVRLREARSQLAQTDVPIAGIANHLGYADAANFTKAFQRWTGKTPSDYRRTKAE